MMLSEAFGTPYPSPATKAVLGGMDTSALAKIALRGMDTSSVLHQAIQALGMSPTMKAVLSGLDTSAFAKQVMPGLDTSAFAKIALRGMAVDTSAWFKSIDIDLMVKGWADWLEAERAGSAEPSSDMAVTPLSRDQVRLL